MPSSFPILQVCSILPGDKATSGWLTQLPGDEDHFCVTHPLWTDQWEGVWHKVAVKERSICCLTGYWELGHESHTMVIRYRVPIQQSIKKQIHFSNLERFENRYLPLSAVICRWSSQINCSPPMHQDAQIPPWPSTGFSWLTIAPTLFPVVPWCSRFDLDPRSAQERPLRPPEKTR